jgi:hypothetical protein
MSRKNLRKLDLDPVDPLVKVPAAVTKSVAAADAAHAAVYGEPQPALGVESPTEPPDPDQQPDNQDGTTATEAPRAQTPEAPPSAPQGGEGDPWEHRYRSLKGRFDTQTTMLQGQESRISQLEGLIATIRTAPQNNPPPQAQRLITPEEERDYGVDFLEVVSKKAREDLGPQLQQISSRLDNISTRLEVDEDQRIESAQQQLWSYLDEQVPDWQEINASDEFLQWLALPDEFSGVIRSTLITQAFERHDAPRVARFFNGFLAEEAAATGTQRPGAGPRAQAPPAPPPNGGNGRQANGKVPLERLAAPGRARTGATSEVPSEKPMISTAQIAQFYADVAANRYRGREAEKNALEAQIFEAQREGRIFR